MGPATPRRVVFRRLDMPEEGPVLCAMAAWVVSTPNPRSTVVISMASGSRSAETRTGSSLCERGVGHRASARRSGGFRVAKLLHIEAKVQDPPRRAA